MDIIEGLVARRTSKIIGEPDSLPINHSDDSALVDDLISAAGNAPFHYACGDIHRRNDLTSPVPWRGYKLSQSSCHDLMNHLIESGDQTKIPNMLAAAQFLIQITFCLQLPVLALEPIGLVVGHCVRLQFLISSTLAIMNF